MSEKEEDRYIIFNSKDVNEDISVQTKSAKQEYQNCLDAGLKDGDKVHVMHRFFAKDSVVIENLEKQLLQKDFEKLYRADFYLNEEHAMYTFYNDERINQEYFDRFHNELSELANSVGAIYLRFDVMEQWGDFALEVGLDIAYRNDQPEFEKEPF
jgi:hypothetical protein